MSRMPAREPGQMEDSMLWERFQNGDTRALDTITEMHYRALFNYGAKFSPSKELVKDCIQDLFLELWKNRQRLGKVVSIRHYLLKSLRRKIIREAEKSNRLLDRNTSMEEYTFTVEFSYESKLVALQHAEEQIQKLNQALDKLSKRQKEAIYLRFYQGLSFEEIASVMTINNQSVRNLVYGAIQLLRKYLAEASILLMLLL
jgi:RNA polymerase sigma factor (sigma-70 family)